MGVFLHGTVGLQHCGYCHFNAYCDSRSIYMTVGKHERRYAAVLESSGTTCPDEAALLVQIREVG